MSLNHNTSADQVNNQANETIKITPKQEFFSWLPNCVIYEWGLAADTLGVALYLNGKSAGWQTRPYDVQKHFGFGKRKWDRISRELKQFGLLTEKKVKDGTELWFGLPDMELKITKKQHSAKTAQCQNSTVLKQHPLANKDLLPEKDLLTHKENNVLSLKQTNLTKEEVQGIFDRLWEKYPLKKSKQKALEALLRILKGRSRDAAENLAIHIWSGLEACVHEFNAKTQLKDQGADIFVPSLPHLVTWLNQARWEDQHQSADELLQGAKSKRSGINLGAIEASWG